jgi:pimeloyl-ACP methyl ester carboxylesterase
MNDRFTPAHRGGAGEPLVLIHGFTDTWRTWELVLPALEREHDVLAITLPGHAGGPPTPDPMTETALADAVEQAMDEAGIETAHIAGNSLGGYLTLQLAARGRARSAVALAPAGGWEPGDSGAADALRQFVLIRDLLLQARPDIDAIAASPAGRRRATALTAVEYEHIPSELIAHIMRGAADCDATLPFTRFTRDHGWPLEGERISCPVRIVWGRSDAILPWPAAAARYRDGLVPGADWVTLPGVGHCPQLDVPDRAAELILEVTASRR